MSFNNYMANAIREQRVKKLMNAKYLAPHTKRFDSAAQRESVEQAAAENRNKALPRYDFAATKWMRIVHPKVS